MIWTITGEEKQQTLNAQRPTSNVQRPIGRAELATMVLKPEPCGYQEFRKSQDRDVTIPKAVVLPTAPKVGDGYNLLTTSSLDVTRNSWHGLCNSLARPWDTYQMIPPAHLIM
jgi:hypothetical protein